jgi:hypothetical protein
MNRAETQQEMRGKLLSHLRTYLDTTPEDQEYTTRMAYILRMLKLYAKGERKREYDEFASAMRDDSPSADVDIYRKVIWELAISALSEAEASLRLAGEKAGRMVEGEAALMAWMPKESRLSNEIREQDEREEREWEAATLDLWTDER